VDDNLVEGLAEDLALNLVLKPREARVRVSPKESVSAMPLIPRRLLPACAALFVTMAAPADARPIRPTIEFDRWDSSGFRAGTEEGTALDDRGLRIDRPIGTVGSPREGGHRTYEFARWTSPVQRAASGANQLVPSWNARTPPGTWLRVDMRGQTSSGTWTPWLSFGRWASGDEDIQRTSIAGQQGIDVDTYTASATPLTRYQLRVTLYRAAGTKDSPTVSLVAAMTSALPDRFGVPTSGGGAAWGQELRVPRYSQDIHKGHFPQYGGGGESWCSPTSTEMVVEYWGHRPSTAELAWIPPGHVDPTVDQAARATYDPAYQGTGNWPFNTAYAGTFGLEAYVTRLPSLRAAESYIARGIPVITSQAFHAGEIDGANYNTDGHLMVIVGFTGHGDVIVNDPASPNDAAVRHVYPRAQFENVWLRTKRHTPNGGIADGSGGIVYLIQPRRPPRK
jgi:hypothetical protein